MAAAIESIIVFSHLRWNFVWQRPQHLLSRLSRHCNIHFFEEPVPGQAEPWVQIETPAPHVRVYRPHSALASAGFHDDHIPALQQLVREVTRDEHIENYAVWLYSPMALPLIQELKPLAVVYDCMDELSAFHNAPRQLIQRENALLKRADVVFTGGPSLYRAKRGRHHNVHCFPSSVDADHFRRALQPGVDHPLQHTLAQPRLGYSGVIDERLDLDLLARLADASPHWQICMVGPVVKIDPGSLPQRPNLHYFGQRAYEELPSFMAGWQVCLQPFALNEATRFISPTKTLEYMAAERPIVSTAITDVVEPYGHIVRIARDAASFIEECKCALQISAEESAATAQLMRATAANTSWDQTAERMFALLEMTVHKQSSWAVQMPKLEECSPRGRARAASGEHSTIIVGAGPTGLSAAYHLGEGSLLLEQNDTVGGWCRSVVDRGFTFDHAGHIMFSNDPYVHQLYRRLLGDNVHWQDREAWIYSKNVYTRYPFQGALHGLPPDVLKECILGAIEARFGPFDNQALARSAPMGRSPASGKAESITDCCGDGLIESAATLAAPTHRTRRNGEPANFEEFIYKVWGAGVARHFAIPYNRKLWTVPLSEMETSWLGGRVPLPDLEEMIDGALRPVGKPSGPNARFGYPLKGGFQALMDGFLPLLEGEVRTRAQVTKVSTRTRTVTLTDGSCYRYRHLISTAPLPKLIEMIGAEAPEEIRAAAQRLRHVSVRCVNLGVARERVTDKHWIYYPEDTIFHRIFAQGNASPHCSPPGCFGITCEITYSPCKPLPCEADALIERCVQDCIRVGLLHASDRIIVSNQIDMPHAYVIYDHERRANVELIRQWLLKREILLAGRYSEWEYYNSDHAFIAGKKVAEAVGRSHAAKDSAYRLPREATSDGRGVVGQDSL